MSQARKKILIVDDDARNIFALSAVLRAKGFDCLSCMAASEAIDMFEAGDHVDAVLIDMMMPDMDGYEAIPVLRKLPRGNKIPIIAVTAQAMPGDSKRSLDAGADAYVSKPVDIDRLMELLNRML